MEIEKKLRYRINISTSVKGVKTWDATVDGENFTEEVILAKSVSLVARISFFVKFSPSTVASQVFTPLTLVEMLIRYRSFLSISMLILLYWCFIEQFYCLTDGLCRV